MCRPRCAINDIGGPSSCVCLFSPDDKVINPVPVDIARGRHTKTGKIPCRRTCDGEPFARFQGGQVNLVRDGFYAVNNIGRPCILSAPVIPIRPDNQVIDPVPVNVTRSRNTNTRTINVRFTRNGEALACG